MTSTPSEKAETPTELSNLKAMVVGRQLINNKLCYTLWLLVTHRKIYVTTMKDDYRLWTVVSVKAWKSDIVDLEDWEVTGEDPDYFTRKIVDGHEVIELPVSDHDTLPGMFYNELIGKIEKSDVTIPEGSQAAIIGIHRVFQDDEFFGFTAIKNHDRKFDKKIKDEIPCSIL